MSYGGLILAVACSSSADPELVLDGPSEVRVEALGPVDGPRVRLADGRVPDGLIWTLSRDGVARIEDGRVIASGPGVVEVVAEWEGERVEWTLRVELQTTLGFVDPPSSLQLGVPTPMAVTAKVGEAPVDAGPILWATSNASVLTVDEVGTVLGLSVGVAYLSATARGSSAMVEIEVVP